MRIVCVCVGVGLRARVYMNIRINNNYPCSMYNAHVGRTGPAEATGKPDLEQSFFRGVSDVDCVDVEASAMLAEGSDSRVHHVRVSSRPNPIAI